MAIAFGFVIISISLIPAFAHNPGYINTTWFQFGGQPEMCYLEYQLKNLRVNGNTGNGDLVEAAVEATRIHFNSKIDGLTIDGEDNRCSFNRIEVGAKNLGWNVYAQTQLTAYYPNPNYKNYAEMEIDFNTSHNWEIDSLKCGFWDNKDPRLLANHEFGHALSLGHHAGYDHSMMNPGCTSKLDKIQSVDEAALEARYS